jgi:hypothetical protein
MARKEERDQYQRGDRDHGRRRSDSREYVRRSRSRSPTRFNPNALLRRGGRDFSPDDKVVQRKNNRENRDHTDRPNHTERVNQNREDHSERANHRPLIIKRRDEMSPERRSPSPQFRIRVENLPLSVDSFQLRKAFKDFGRVKFCKVPEDD